MTAFLTLRCPLRAWSVAVLLALAANPALAAAPFVDNGDGTVTDTSTGLMWDQCSLGRSGAGCTAGAATTLTWSDALGQAATQNAANYKGYSDWRMPGIVELKTLVKSGVGSPSIDSVAFPNTVAGEFWSGSSPDPAGAWVVLFYGGYTYANDKTVTGHVRLVRSGQYVGSFALLSGSAVSGITTSTATLSATSPSAATGYWLAVPRDATPPTPPQVIAGVDYGGVAVKAGSGAMAAKTATSFSLTGLAAGTAYDLYVLAREGSYNTNSALTGPLQFITAATPAPATRSVLIDPDTATTLYAAVDSQGVFRSTDSGGTWTAAGAQPANLNVKALAKRSGTPLYVATYGGGVFKTGANDTTFAACATQPTNANTLALTLAASGTLYAGTEGGVFKSTDACATWTAMNTGLPN